MLEKYLKNIQTRRVLFEKYIENTGLYAMKFTLNKTKKESLLLIKIKLYKEGNFPVINCEMQTTDGNLYEMILDPFEVEIFDFLDDNNSTTFIKWLKHFESGRSNFLGGANIEFIDLNSKEQKLVMSMTGCTVNSIKISNEKLGLSFDFFAYYINN